jgi:hypothetical protein
MLRNRHNPNRRDLLRLSLGGISTALLGDSLIGSVSADPPRPPTARSIIYIFLSGGLSQLDSFDLKPDAPAEVRGEFRPVATSTLGIRICEHLPRLAERSNLWALVRSMSHPSNAHSDGHAMMLTGRTALPPGFDGNRPTPADWPSVAALVGRLCPGSSGLPSAVALPEKLTHMTGRIIPGQFAGQMGSRHDPLFFEASPFRARVYGAYPEYAFTMQPEGRVEDRSAFRAPNFTLPTGVNPAQMRDRLGLLQHVGRLASAERFDQNYRTALSLVSDRRIRWALDVTNAEDRLQARYGRNSFGWSLLMARRFVELGVRFVQVNLGNNETWDLHGSIFPRLRDSLFPPTDRAVSALLDDLHQTGLLDQTLVVMAGEFGRTPRISTLAQHYRFPGRDHWGAAQSVFLAGGGLRGGQVIGATDRHGGHPIAQRQTPENLAATMFDYLGIPHTAEWTDPLDRPHAVYHGEPIAGLL